MLMGAKGNYLIDPMSIGGDTHDEGAGTAAAGRACRLPSGAGRLVRAHVRSADGRAVPRMAAHSDRTPYADRRTDRLGQDAGGTAALPRPGGEDEGAIGPA